MDKVACKNELKSIAGMLEEPPVEELQRNTARFTGKSAGEIIKALVKSWAVRFDGTSNVLEFITQLEECANAHAIDVDHILVGMPIALQGSALDWWLTLSPPAVTTWKSFCDAILKDFPPKGAALKWHGFQIRLAFILGNTVVSAVVDTGSTTSLIGMQVACRSEGCIVKEETVLRMANRSLQKYSNAFCTDCQVVDKTFAHSFFIQPKMLADITLGTDFLAKLKTSVMVEDAWVSVQAAESQLQQIVDLTVDQPADTTTSDGRIETPIVAPISELSLNLAEQGSQQASTLSESVGIIPENGIQANQANNSSKEPSKRTNPIGLSPYRCPPVPKIRIIHAKPTCYSYKSDKVSQSKRLNRST